MRNYGERFDRPIFIVSTPRSGSTLLYETLEQAPGLFTTGQESHWIIEDIPALNPANRGWESNRLTSDDAMPATVEALARDFYRDLHDRNGRSADGTVRMLEKTPKNALRVPFFAKAFPDSVFVYLYRDVRQSLASMMEAWASGAFQTYPQLPGWRGLPWSMLLVPGWRDLAGQPLPVVVAHQWAITTRILIDDLSALSRERLRVMTHDLFLERPQESMAALTETLGVGWDRQLGPQLPFSKVTVSPPNSDKWRRLEPQIEAVMAIVTEADERACTFVSEHTVL